MNDNWLILVGLLGIILLGVMPSLIARITGRRVQVRTSTGSFIVGPFKTKKERQIEEEQDKIVKELNKFCQEVASNEMLVASIDSFKYMKFDMGFELPDADGRPMLTKRALKIVNSNNVGKALAGYRKLQHEKANGQIDNNIYGGLLLQLYKECS